MQVPEKWLTPLEHVSTGVPWQRLSVDSGVRRWVPRLRCQYQAAYIAASKDADCKKSGAS